MATGVHLSPREDPRIRITSRDLETVLARQALDENSNSMPATSVKRLWYRMTGSVQDLLHVRARARQRQRAQLDVFEKQCERLIELLCSAAHEGIRPEQEITYRNARTWMCEHYPPLAKPLRGYWRQGNGEERDPVAGLFSSRELKDAITADTTIEDIMRSRCAFEAYRADLDGLTA